MKGLGTRLKAFWLPVFRRRQTTAIMNNRPPVRAYALLYAMRNSKYITIIVMALHNDATYNIIESPGLSLLSHLLSHRMDRLPGGNVPSSQSVSFECRNHIAAITYIIQ